MSLSDTLGSEKRGFSRSTSTLLKLGLIGFLLLIMQIPLHMVLGVIEERQGNNSQVATEIAKAWADNQEIVGPILEIPYKVHEINDKGKPTTTTQRIFILPKTLNIQGILKPETRYM